MEWSNEKVITFLEVLQTEPCLWNPKPKNFKNRVSQNDAWRRIIELLPFKVSIEESKKKKESLIGYYRTHLNKYKKSLKSGAGKDDVYTTNWFAYEIMDSFLRGVYASNLTINTETNDCSEAQESSEGKNDENDKSLSLSSAVEGATQNIHIENRTRPRQNKSFQYYGKKRQLKDDLPPEIRAARRQMDEVFEFMKQKKDDEYEMFGRLIASKIKKIRNPNTRDMLMNDIHNLVFRTCMADRLEEQPAVPQRSPSLSPHPQLNSPSPHPSSYYSPPGHSTSLSPHHQVHSPSPHPSPYESPPGPSTSLSPHHQVYSPSPHPSSYESPPGPSTSQYPHHKVHSPSSHSSSCELLPGPSISMSPHHQVYSPTPNPSSYEALPNATVSQSPDDHESPSTLHQLLVQSSQNFVELPPARASQIVITGTGEIKIIKD